MSALSGLRVDATGRLLTVASLATPDNLFRAMAIVANELAVNADSGQVREFNGSVSMNPAGQVIIDDVGAIDHYSSGLPLTANGSLCTDLVGAITFYDQAVGRTAAGRVAIV